MIAFFVFARAMRAAYVAVRAAVGIMIVLHGATMWAKARRA